MVEEQLNEVGITTAEELAETGAKEAWLKSSLRKTMMHWQTSMCVVIYI